MNVLSLQWSKVMKTIHKYEVPMPPATLKLDLPEGSNILSLRYVQMDKGLFMWAEVPAGLKVAKETREFRAFKTGDGIPEHDVYIATAIDQHQPEVYHLYEVITIAE